MIDQRAVAKTFGVVLLAVGVLGFLPNPVASGDGIFQVNALHNVVHVLSGAVALGAGFAGDGSYARTYNVGFGAVYALVAVLGFLGVLVPDLLAVNAADNVLHLLIAVVLLGAGLTLEKGSTTSAA